MPVKINPYKMGDLLSQGDVRVEMVMVEKAVYFRGYANNECFVFVTKRGDIATFKSIRACQDFITKFLQGLRIEVVSNEEDFNSNI